MKIALIDNYDSFTYNLYHYLDEYAAVKVYRNDQFELSDLNVFDKIVISPGPGLPKQAGLTMDVLAQYHQTKPILGVCLGLQAIVEFYGGRLYNLPNVLHGKSTNCTRTADDGLFDGISGHFAIGHYHSWAADPDHLPQELEITSVNSDNIIMSLRHRSLPINAVQFHPESVMTPDGKKMLKNWVNLR